MNVDLAANLKLLCSYHGPVADVCRRIGVNRQQFTKYLSGQSRPSRHNMRKICDFFGVDEYEVLLPHDRFVTIIRVKPVGQPETDPTIRQVRHLLEAGGRQTGSLSKYLGWYYKYFYSFSRPNFILRSLVRVFPFQGGIYYKTIERLKSPESAGDLAFTFKYLGRLFLVGERIHMIDLETLLGNEVSHTILYPSYLSRVSYLPGAMIGVSGSEGHQPVGARVIMEYIGLSVGLRPALAGCGLFAPGALEIPGAVTRYIDNGLRDGQSTLRADPVL